LLLAAQARKAIEAGMITLNGVKIKAKSHQRVIEEGDVLAGGLVVFRLGKLLHKAVRVQ
jgi:tyrosyl-tRNA synthetase